VILQRTSADFGTLEILENANRAALLFGDAPQARNVPRMITMGAMREIQARDIHTEKHEIAENRFAVTGGTDGADNFGAATWRGSYV
jgi:hypothetical protein